MQPTKLLKKDLNLTHAKPTLYSKAAFYLICSLILFAPLARGSVHPWAVTILQVGVIAAAICLIIETFSKKGMVMPRTPMDKPIIAIFLLCLISFAFSDLKPFSFDGMVTLLVYITAYYTIVSAMRTRKEQRTLVNAIIFTALLISAIGIFKRFDIPVFSWWNYPDIAMRPQIDSISGPYVNRNHMAGFLEMAIPFALVLLSIRTRNREETCALIAITLFLLVSQTFTLSRGGWISTLGAILFMTTVLLYRRKTIRTKPVAVIGTGIIIMSLFIISNLPVVERITTLTRQDYEDNMSGRLRCWKGVVNQIKDNPLLGTGPNTFAEVYPAWQIPGNASLRRYAHNDYLHYLSETGVFFVPVILFTIYFFFQTGFRRFKSRSRQIRGFTLAAMAGVFAILIHSISDFNLNIPANAFLFVVITGIATRGVLLQNP